MPVSLSASLVATGTPPSVQLVLADVPAGAPYVVQGSALATTWPVPGGTGVAEGGQIVLVDNRSALNTPVVYTATVAGVTYAASPVTVALPRHRYLLQSLDGRTVVSFTWVRNNDPRQMGIRTQAIAVAGRSRPVVRFDVSGGETGELVADTSGANTRAMRALLERNRPLVLRTDGRMEDFAAVEIVMPTGASRALTGGIDERGDAWRRWTIPFAVIDDPEPSRALSAWSWDDFDEAMASRVWTGTSTRVNLITNPSAETSTTGWSTLAAGSTGALTLSRVSDSQPPGGGSWAFQLNAAALATTTANVAGVHTEAPAVPGSRHTFQAQLRWVSGAAPAGAVARVSVQYGSDSALLGSPTVSTTVPVSQLTYVARTVTASAVAPAGTTRVRVSVQMLGGTSAGSATVRFDMALVETGTVAGTYFDGSTASTSSMSHTWDGVAHASTSRAQSIDEGSFDALFAGITWDQWDAYDWSQL